jgi:hypothetical protein
MRRHGLTQSSPTRDSLPTYTRGARVDGWMGGAELKGGGGGGEVRLGGGRSMVWVGG